MKSQIKSRKSLQIAGVILFGSFGAVVPALAQTAALPPAATAPQAGAAPLAVTPSYQLAAGDVVGVSVADFPTLSTQSTVAPDGTVTMPLLHQVSLTGLTLDQATALMTTRLKKYVVDPVVTVSLLSKHSQIIVFSGSVTRPGPMEYRPGLHLLEALAEVGGFVLTGTPAAGSSTTVGLQTTIADPSHVTVTHADSTKDTLNLTHPEQLAGSPADIALAPGDIIYVPQQLGKINVIGQVRSPGVIPYRDNLTIFDAVSDSGGYNQETADLPNSTFTHNGRTSPINLEPMLLHGDMAANIVMAPGDQISIPEKTRTFVMGDVNRPGYYLYRPGDRVLDAISAVSGPTGSADLGKINLIHTDKVRRVSQMVRVNLNDYLLRNNPAGNPFIQPGDSLYIPDKQHHVSLGEIFGDLSGAGSAVYAGRALQGH